MATVIDYPFEMNNNTCENATSVIMRVLNDGLQLQEDYELNDNILRFLKGLGRMFYIVNPEETTFSKVEYVPHFYRQAWPYFLLFILLENIVLWLEREPVIRLNDGIISASHGILQECGRFVFRGAESYMYIYIYENFRLFNISGDSIWTWYLAAIGVDFCYYWVHRACHEVHILWSQHQVHHSSEEFNMIVGLRQSIVQGWCGFIFYLPLALVVPPAHFLTHQQFNLLYQFWIHTKAVQHLGPLEWVLNTPNHHRVHHGSNLYCLDKNYGGVFIIWDRIFGTFGEEDKTEDIIYGLVVNQPSFNLLHLQTFYTAYVFEKCKSMEGWKDKLAAIFWGPSWIPGRPRLGLDEDKIKVGPREKYNVSIPAWCSAYLLVHFCVVVYGFQELAARHVGMSPISVFCFVLYIMASLTVFGLFFDNNPYACVFELVRCMVLVTYVQRAVIPDVNATVLLSAEVFFLLSGIFWCLQSLRVLEITVKAKKY